MADGAMDNYPTYELLHSWNITPFIPLILMLRLSSRASCHQVFYALMIRVIPFALPASLIKTAVIRIIRVSITVVGLLTKVLIAL